LDTSVLAAILRKEEDVIGRFEKAVLQGVRMSTTPINLCELYVGVYGSRDPTRELGKVDGLINLLDVLEFGVDASRIYGEKSNRSQLKNKPIGDFDLIIACIAMSHGEALVTRNIRHFRNVPDLVIEEW
jgi:tRNA(fMet)-specific endonuclease VapC